MSKEKLSTPPKNCTNKSSIVSSHPSTSDNMNIDNPSDQMKTGLQERKKSIALILFYAPRLKSQHQLYQAKDPKDKWIPFPCV